MKSFIVLALAGGACQVLRRASAASRYLIWFLAVLSLPLLPLVTWMTPNWHRPLWSISTEVSSGNEISLALEIAPPTRTGSLSAPTPASKARSSGLDSSTSSNGRLGTRFAPNWFALGLAVWLSGVLLVVMNLLRARLHLKHIAQQARPVAAGNHASLLAGACERLEVQRPVVLLTSDDEVMPITWGAWKHFILLPSQSAHWPEERTRVVLLHELAHVKRRDCFTQTITSFICAIYWFNPLVWLAARSMRVERERACDDLVLGGGCKASEYAEHLLDIARTFRSIQGTTAIAMARSSKLEERIAAIVDDSRARRAPNVFLVGLGCLLGLGLIAGVAAQNTAEGQNLRQQQMAHLQAFSAAKYGQALKLSAAANEKILPEFEAFFDAAIRGDFQTVTNKYADFKRRHPQYSNSSSDQNLSSSAWQPVLEICLAYFDVAAGEPKYTQMAVDDIIGSIPAGSIYFGGTDPGRGLITAFSKSQITGDPFFTLTQNALADSNYLDYLRRTYGDKLSLPSDEDSKKCYDEYSADALRRLKHDQSSPKEPRQVKPGEEIRLVDGKAQVKGQIAVMAINGLLSKIIFDRNPGHEFYVEESFPLDWMYPYLTPNGLVLKINHKPVSQLNEEVVTRDREFWRAHVDQILGNWLTPETPVQTIADFVDKVYVRKDLTGFTGDPAFIRNDYPQRMISKWRSSIAGVYAWRIPQSKNPSEQKRMLDAADFAFRQAFALCPNSPEAVFRYVNLLISLGRLDDAILLVETARKVDPTQRRLENMIYELKRIKGSQR